MTRIKICGLTNVDDALHAARCGANLLGFIFADSPRRVSIEQARDIVAAIRNAGFAHILPVGVFVNAPPGDVIGTCLDADLGAAQLHGDETPDQCRVIAHAGIAVIKSFRVRDRASLEPVIHYDCADYILCDTYDPRRAGGTGRAFDHSLVAGLSATYRLILAGGLTPENVADAIAMARPWAVDVSSGVEASPGKKDPAKVEAFIRNVREIK
ncbi:MAG: phosphoribosylanthranilate isomerase [Candidatus Sumerlaeia bacterium]|nr:phosphoribosylanthranilate isomerase [Candidatus Sumerlaeia bacterium]